MKRLSRLYWILLIILIPAAGEGATQYRDGRESGIRTLYEDLPLESIGFKEEYYLGCRWRTYLIEDVNAPESPLTLSVPNFVGRFEVGMTQAVIDLWNEGYYTADIILWNGFPPREPGGWMISGRRRAESGFEEEARRQVELARRTQHDVLLQELEELRTRGEPRSSDESNAKDWRARHAVKLFKSGSCGANTQGETTWIKNGSARDISATILIEVSGNSWQEFDSGTTAVRVPAWTSVKVGCTQPVWNRVYSYQILNAGFLR